MASPHLSPLNVLSVPGVDFRGVLLLRVVRFVFVVCPDRLRASSDGPSARASDVGVPRPSSVWHLDGVCFDRAQKLSVVG